MLLILEHYLVYRLKLNPQSTDIKFYFYQINTNINFFFRSLSTIPNKSLIFSIYQITSLQDFSCQTLHQILLGLQKLCQDQMHWLEHQSICPPPSLFETLSYFQTKLF